MNISSYLLDGKNWSRPGGITDLLLQHLGYTAAAVALAAAVAIPLGIVSGHTGRGAGLLTGVTRAARAIPVLGLLVLVALLGSGALGTVLLVAILAVLPILTATAVGVRCADRTSVQAAHGLGMTTAQLVASVEGPLALPQIISGLRRATMVVVAALTVAAFTVRRGLGELILAGQQAGRYPQVFAGATLVAGLAVALSLVWSGLGWWAVRRTRARDQASRSMASAVA
jgi:osmoprotectant transport system permease protein